MLQRIIVGAAAVSFAFMALIGGVEAAPKSPPPKKPSTRSVPAASSAPTVVTDQVFVTQATYGSNTEISLGNLMLHSALSGHLREFAIKLVHDHTMLKNELAKIASGGGFKSPTGIDPSMVETMKRLGKLNGIAFDNAVRPILVKTHQQAVALFKAEIASGKNKELVAWAKQRLPMLQMHLSMAIKDSVGHTDNAIPKKTK